MLTIVWGTKHPFEKEWEKDWLSLFFNSLDTEYNIINLTNINQIYNNALIVINHDINYMAYLYQYEQKNIPFAVIHLSDEWTNDNTEFYNYKMCKFVYRNYFHPRFKLDKINFFLLGYKNEFWKDYNGVDPMNITTQEREYKWSFAGTPKHTRHIKLDKFKSLEPNKVVWEYGDSFGIQTTGLKTNEYRELMLNSTFIICLEGNYSVDSFRVCEALECGCIPVVVSINYWTSILNMNPPFIVTDSWDDNFNKINAMTVNEIEEMRIKCVQFWNEYKANLKNGLKTKIDMYLK